MTRIIKPLFALLATAAMGFVSTDVDAGYSVTPSAYCNISNGSGYCYGTFLGFLNSSNAYDYVYFETGPSQTLFFGAMSGGSPYSCTAAAGSPVQTYVANSTMSSRDFFDISFSNGTCTGITIINASYMPAEQ